MMQAIQNWGYALCVAALVSCIIQIISPEGVMKKIINMVLSIFFICCLLSPILGNTEIHLLTQEISNDEANHIAQQIELNVTEQYYAIAEQNIKTIVTEKLAEIKVVPKEIKVCINKESDDSVSIDRIEIQLAEKDEEMHSYIRKYLMDYLGINILLEYAE